MKVIYLCIIDIYNVQRKRVRVGKCSPFNRQSEKYNIDFKFGMIKHAKNLTIVKIQVKIYYILIFIKELGTMF